MDLRPTEAFLSNAAYSDGDLGSSAFSSPTSEYASNVIHHENTAQRVAFVHAVMGSPAISTLANAIRKKFLKSFPISIQELNQNPPQAIATAMGHLDLNRQGQRSTQPLVEEESDEESEEEGVKDDRMPTREVITKYVKLTGMNYMDKTGRFPVPSRSGNTSVLIMLCKDSNNIHAIPVSDGSGKALLAGYKEGYEMFKRSGFQPRFERLDNEAPKVLTDFMKNNSIRFQLVPPNNKRSNAAEESFHQHTLHHGSFFPSQPMGPTHPASQHNAEPTPRISHQPHHLSI